MPTPSEVRTAAMNLAYADTEQIEEEIRHILKRLAVLRAALAAAKREEKATR